MQIFFVITSYAYYLLLPNNRLTMVISLSHNETPEEYSLVSMLV